MYAYRKQPVMNLMDMVRYSIYYTGPELLVHNVCDLIAMLIILYYKVTNVHGRSHGDASLL